MGYMPDWKNFEPNEDDIRHALEETKKWTSLAALQRALFKPAMEAHFRYVDWPAMKKVVMEMVERGEIVKFRTGTGFFKYQLKETVDATKEFFENRRRNQNRG